MLGELRAIGNGKRIVLSATQVLVGRHRLCEVVIHSATVEPVHCHLFVQGSSWHVRSFHANDTRVNAMRVTASRLVPGDILWIGPGHKFEVHYDPETLARTRYRDRVVAPEARGETRWHDWVPLPASRLHAYLQALSASVAAAPVLRY
jgi:pSer/pThr/pTyr-binding forkhead associated (FHA) protein